MSSSSYKAFSEKYDRYYKTTRTSRGLTYRYLSVPSSSPSSSLPTLLWLHGFPSSVYDWHHQLDFFAAKGYAQIVPDMLGYGGTDKPDDPAAYVKTLLAQDVYDIVVAEGTPVVAIGHDWGAGAVLSRVADLYGDNERFKAFVFAAAGYLGPDAKTPYKLDELLPLQMQMFGVELFAYWEFFSKENADEICKENFNSFMDMLYAADAFNVWKAVMSTRYETEKFIGGGKRTERATYISSDDYAVMREHLLGPGRGLKGPLNWYSVHTEGHTQAADKRPGGGLEPWHSAIVRDAQHHELDADGCHYTIAPQRLIEQLGDKLPLKLPKSLPVLFVGTKQDAICKPDIMGPLTEKIAPNYTAVELDTSHWVFLEQPDEFNAAILQWLEAKVLGR